MQEPIELDSSDPSQPYIRFHNKGSVLENKSFNHIIVSVVSLGLGYHALLILFYCFLEAAAMVFI